MPSVFDIQARAETEGWADCWYVCVGSDVGDVPLTLEQAANKARELGQDLHVSNYDQVQAGEAEWILLTKPPMQDVYGSSAEAVEHFKQQANERLAESTPSPEAAVASPRYRVTEDQRIYLISEGLLSQAELSKISEKAAAKMIRRHQIKMFISGFFRWVFKVALLIGIAVGLFSVWQLYIEPKPLTGRLLIDDALLNKSSGARRLLATEKLPPLLESKLRECLYNFEQVVRPGSNRNFEGEWKRLLGRIPRPTVNEGETRVGGVGSTDLEDVAGRDVYVRVYEQFRRARLDQLLSTVENVRKSLRQELAEVSGVKADLDATKWQLKDYILELETYLDRVERLGKDYQSGGKLPLDQRLSRFQFSRNQVSLELEEWLNLNVLGHGDLDEEGRYEVDLADQNSEVGDYLLEIYLRGQGNICFPVTDNPFVVFEEAY